MTHIFTKRGYKGFTLIELLVVIAIIGLLSTVIAAPIQNARKKSRDAKKIAELKAVELALDQYAEANKGQYPAAFSQLAGTYMPILPVFTSSSTSVTPVRDRFAYSYFTGQLAGGAAAPELFAYHLGVHLESVGPALDSDRDCSGVVSDVLLNPTVNIPYPCANFNGPAGNAAAVQVVYANYAAGALCSTGVYPATATTTPPVGICTIAAVDSDTPQSDFGIMNDGNIVSCNLVNDCVFDMGNQQ